MLSFFLSMLIQCNKVQPVFALGSGRKYCKLRFLLDKKRNEHITVSSSALAYLQIVFVSKCFIQGDFFSTQCSFRQLYFMYVLNLKWVILNIHVKYFIITIYWIKQFYYFIKLFFRMYYSFFNSSFNASISKILTYNLKKFSFLKSQVVNFY